MKLHDITAFALMLVCFGKHTVKSVREIYLFYLFFEGEESNLQSNEETDNDHFHCVKLYWSSLSLCPILKGISALACENAQF